MLVALFPCRRSRVIDTCSTRPRLCGEGARQAVHVTRLASDMYHAETSEWHGSNHSLRTTIDGQGAHRWPAHELTSGGRCTSGLDDDHMHTAGALWTQLRVRLCSDHHFPRLQTYFPKDAHHKGSRNSQNPKSKPTGGP